MHFSEVLYVATEKFEKIIQVVESVPYLHKSNINHSFRLQGADTFDYLFSS